MHHWLIFCTFTHSLLSLVLGRLATPFDWYTRERKTLVLVAHTAHLLRREIVARNGLSHGKFGVGKCINTHDRPAQLLKSAHEIMSHLPLGVDAARRYLYAITVSPSATEEDSCEFSLHSLAPCLPEQLSLRIAHRRTVRNNFSTVIVGVTT